MNVGAAGTGANHYRGETVGRYAQCDDTCTVDCGACKGAGRPAAPAAEADLRAVIVRGIRERINMRPVWTAERLADHLLAGPLQRLVAEAAEARRLRETVTRVRSMRAVAQANAVTTAALDWALDGEGTDG